MPELPCHGAVLHYEQVGEGPDIVWLASGDMPGSSWWAFQIPYFEDSFRNTTYDARGVGQTTCLTPPPWSMKEYAADCAALIEARCNPPVALVGLSMGSLIAQQVSLDRPELVRCAILMGTAARSTGFLHDWMGAEIALHREGGQLSEAFATTHYAAFYYPSEVLGDDELWSKLRPYLASNYERRDGTLLAAQWQACQEFDSLERLPHCDVPLHVFAFSHDVQTPPARGRLVADTAGNGHFHLFEGLGHGSIFGHKPDVVNAAIRSVIDPYITG